MTSLGVAGTGVGGDGQGARFESLLGKLMIAGVVFSLSTIVVGGLISLSRHPDYATSSDALGLLTGPGREVPRSIGALFEGIGHGQGWAVVMLGVLGLIVVTIVRVALLAFLFLRQRDRMLALMTFLVLVLLAASFTLGRASG